MILLLNTWIGRVRMPAEIVYFEVQIKF